jgi:hypothetical protein
LGFLYWLEELYPKFEQFSEDEEFRQDVLYNINYDAEDSFEVGDYYVNNSWINDESRGLEFEWLGKTDDLDSSQDIEKSENKVGCRNVKISVQEKPTKQKHSEEEK